MRPNLSHLTGLLHFMVGVKKISNVKQFCRRQVIVKTFILSVNKPTEFFPKRQKAVLAFLQMPTYF